MDFRCPTCHDVWPSDYCPQCGKSIRFSEGDAPDEAKGAGPLVRKDVLEVYCPSCKLNYRIGEDAIVVRMEDVHSSFGGVVASETAMRQSLAEPHLICRPPESEPSDRVENLLESRKRAVSIKQELAKGLSMQWRCGRCENVYDYISSHTATSSADTKAEGTSDKCSICGWAPMGGPVCRKCGHTKWENLYYFLVGSLVLTVFAYALYVEKHPFAAVFLAAIGFLTLGFWFVELREIVRTRRLIHSGENFYILLRGALILCGVLQSASYYYIAHGYYYSYRPNYSIITISSIFAVFFWVLCIILCSELRKALNYERRPSLCARISETIPCHQLD